MFLEELLVKAKTLNFIEMEVYGLRETRLGLD